MLMSCKRIVFIAILGLLLPSISKTQQNQKSEGIGQHKSPAEPTRTVYSWWKKKNPFRFTLDSTQNKEDLKEVVEFTAIKAQEVFQGMLSSLLNGLENPENKEKMKNIRGKIVPQCAVDYLKASSKEKKREVLNRLMEDINSLVDNAGQAAKEYKVFENIRARFYPTTFDLAYYGFVFGSAVFIGFNGLYYVQQMLRDYLAIRKPKYISPFSRIGLFDQYKQMINTYFYGLKKQPDDVQLESIASALGENGSTDGDNKKRYYNCLVRVPNITFVKDESTRLLGSVANKLEMDFIAVSSINLLQKHTVTDIWNDLVHIIHKNKRPVLLYIDNISLLSMDGTEYSEREECIRMLALAIKSSADVLRSKCMIVGLLDQQELFEGPFADIYTKQLYI